MSGTNGHAEHAGPRVLHVRREDVAGVVHPTHQVSALAVHPTLPVAYLGRANDWDKQRRNLIVVERPDDPSPAITAHADSATPLPPTGLLGDNTSNVLALAVHPSGSHLFLGLSPKIGTADADLAWNEPLPEFGGHLRSADLLDELQHGVLSWYELDGAGHPIPETLRTIQLGSANRWQSVTSMQLDAAGRHLYLGTATGGVSFEFAVVRLTAAGAPARIRKGGPHGPVAGPVNVTYHPAPGPPVLLSLSPDDGDLCILTDGHGGGPKEAWHWRLVNDRPDPPQPTSIDVPGDVIPSAFACTDGQLWWSPWTRTDPLVGTTPLHTTLLGAGPPAHQTAPAADMPAPIDASLNQNLPEAGHHLVAAAVPEGLITALAIRGTDAGTDAPSHLRTHRLDGFELVALRDEGKAISRRLLDTFDHRRPLGVTHNRGLTGSPGQVAVLSRAIPVAQRSIRHADVRVHLTVEQAAALELDGTRRPLPDDTITVNVLTNGRDTGSVDLAVGPGSPGIEASISANQPAAYEAYNLVRILETGGKGATPHHDRLLLTVRAVLSERSPTGGRTTISERVTTIIGRDVHFFVSPLSAATLTLENVEDRTEHYLTEVEALTGGVPVVGPQTFRSSMYHVRADGTQGPAGGPALREFSNMARAVGHLGYNMMEREAVGAIPPHATQGLAITSGLAQRSVGTGAPIGTPRRSEVPWYFADFYRASVVPDPVTHDELIADVDRVLRHYWLDGSEVLASVVTFDDYQVPTDVLGPLDADGKISPLWRTVAGDHVYTACFHAYVALHPESGLTAADVPFDFATTATTLHDRRRKVWTVRFLQEQMEDQLAITLPTLLTRALRPGLPSRERNRSRWGLVRHPFIGVQQMTPGEPFRQDTASKATINIDTLGTARAGLVNPYAYNATGPSGHPKGATFTAALLRTAAMNTDLGFPDHPTAALRQPGLLEFGSVIFAQSVSDFPHWLVHCTFAVIGRGGTYAPTYTFGPNWIVVPDGRSDIDSDDRSNLFEQAIAINRLLGRSEALLLRCLPGRGRIAILLPATTNLFSHAVPDPMHDSTSPHRFEAQALHWILRLRGFEVDLISEGDLVAGALGRGYGTVFTVGRNIGAAAQQALAAWVQAPGSTAQLVAIMGAGTADEFDEPTSTLDTLLGVATRTGAHTPTDWELDPGPRELAPTSAASAAPGSTKLANVVVAGRCSPLVPKPGTTTVAELVAGRSITPGTARPVITRRAVGTAATWAYGFHPGTEVDDRCDQLTPLTDERRYADGYDHRLIDLALLPVAAAGLHPRVSLGAGSFGVETCVLEEPSPEGSPAALAVTFQNWTNQRPRPVLATIERAPTEAVDVTLASGRNVVATSIGDVLIVCFELDSVDVLLVDRAIVVPIVMDLASFLDEIDRHVRPPHLDASAWLAATVEGASPAVRAAVQAQLA